MSKHSSSATDPLLQPKDREIKSSLSVKCCCCRDPAENPTGAVVAAVIATLGSFMFGFNLGFTSPALPSMEWGSDSAFTDCAEWNQDPSGGYTCKESFHGASFASIINFGAMLGAFAGGPLADLIGRKYSVMLSALPLASGWAWIAIDSNYYGFLAGRLLTGFGMGMVTICVNVYITEISPSNLRGALSSLFQLNLTIGILAVYLIGEFLTTETTVLASMNTENPKGFASGTHQECNWRLLSVIGSTISLFMFFGMIFMPESPKYLLTHGRRVEAMAVLKFFKGSEYDAISEINAYGQKNPESKQENGSAESDSTCAETWMSRSSLLPLSIMLVLHLTQQFSGINAVIFFCQEIFLDAGVTNPVLASLIVAVVQVGFTGLLTLGLLDMAGRRFMLTLSLVGMACSCLAMSAAFHLKEIGNRQDWLAVLSLLLYISTFSLGAGAIVWVIMGELLPLRIRGVGGSIASGFNWSCSFLVTGSFQFMLTRLQGTGTFLVYAGVCAFGAVFTLLAVPETKGLELEAIEALFAKKDN